MSASLVFGPLSRRSGWCCNVEPAAPGPQLIISGWFVEMTSHERAAARQFAGYAPIFPCAGVAFAARDMEVMSLLTDSAKPAAALRHNASTPAMRVGSRTDGASDRRSPWAPAAQHQEKHMEDT